MENLSLEEENITKDMRNLFRQKKNKITLQLKKKEIFLDEEKKLRAIKDRILIDIKNLFEHEKVVEDYYEPIRVIMMNIDNDEQRVLHSKSDNVEIMTNDKANEIIEELLDSLKNRYQNNLELMKVPEFVFDYIQLWYYKCHKVNSNCDGSSYIDSPGWIEIKKLIINSIYKKYNKCFQYAVTVALNYEEI